MVAEMELKDLNPESVAWLYQRASLVSATPLSFVFEKINLSLCVGS